MIAPFRLHYPLIGLERLFASGLRASLVMGSTCDSTVPEKNPSDRCLRARNTEAQRRTEMKDVRHVC